MRRAIVEIIPTSCSQNGIPAVSKYFFCLFFGYSEMLYNASAANRKIWLV
jgi:hypothetical protein